MTDQEELERPPKRPRYIELRIELGFIPSWVNTPDSLIEISLRNGGTTWAIDEADLSDFVDTLWEAGCEFEGDNGHEFEDPTEIKNQIHGGFIESEITGDEE